MSLQIAIINAIGGDNGGTYGRRCVKALPATNVGNTYFTANWEAYAKAYYYLIDVSTSPTFSSFVYENLIVTGTSHEFIGLADNVTYYYRVAAVVDIQFENFYDQFNESTGYIEVNTSSDPRSDLFAEFSLLNYPAVYQEDKVYTQFPIGGGGNLDFVRSTAKTFYAADGFVTDAPWNNGGRTNEFNNTSVWVTNTNITKTQPGIANPLDGQLNAWQVSATSNGNFSFFGSPGASFYYGYAQTESLFVKAGSCYVLGLRDGSVTGQEVVFNIANGTVISSNVGDRWTIEDYGDGWYRISKTVISGSGAAGVRLEFAGKESGGAAVAGQYCYIYGYQWEQSNRNAAPWSPRPYFQLTDRLNVPAMDHYYGNEQGITIEPTRTNLIKYSENMTVTGGVNWSPNSSGTMVKAGVRCPDGSNNAFRMTTSGSGFSGWYQSISNSIQCQSVYAKYENARYLTVIDVSGGFPGVSFDLLNGVVSGIRAGHFAYMENVGNGWFRCVWGNPTTIYALIQFWLSNSSLSGITPAGGTVLLWGPQAETMVPKSSNTRATSYIRTWTTTVTRGADQLTKSGISSLIGATAGTGYIEYIHNPYNEGVIFGWRSANTPYWAHSSGVFNNGTGSLWWQTYSGGTYQGNLAIDMSPYAVGSRIKIALVYTTTTQKLFINGVLKGSHTIGAMSLNMDAIRVLSYEDSTSEVEPYNNTTKLFAVGIAKRAFTDAEAIAITSAYINPSFDPDYQAILNYAVTNNFALPSYKQQVLQNQLVLDLKAAGVWTELDTLAVFANDGGDQFARIDWKRLSLYSLVNNPSFSQNIGFTGNDSNAYIDTNWNPATSGVKYTQNNASIVVYAPFVQVSPSNFKTIANMWDSVNNRFSFIGADITATNQIKMATNQVNSGVFGVTLIANTPWKNSSRVNNTLYAYQDLNVSTGTVASTPNPNVTLQLFRWTDGTNYSGSSASFIAAGASMNSLNAAFRTAWLNYYNAL